MATPEYIESHRLRNIGIAALVIVIIGSLVAAGYFYKKYDDLKKNPSAATTQETQSLVTTVGKLLTLPSSETPTVATVSDQTKLKDQPFFKNAQNGDKLLIYTTAKQAIIYRESTNKIINVGPIAIDASAAQATATPTPTTTAIPRR